MNLIKRLTVITILAGLALVAAPGMSRAAITMISPAAGATGVSQSPTLVATDLALGTSVQYHFQMSLAAAMTSLTGDFDQTSAQVFASSGAFSGQDSTFTVAGDAYSRVSTATFVFYSSSSVKLSANTVYYWQVQAKPYGGSYGSWSSVQSFTTGQIASASPVNNLAISGVSLYGATSAGLATIGFTIAENNVSTGMSADLTASYNTADWIFVKFSTMSGADGTWNHATLTGGVAAAGASAIVASDNKGVFLNHTAVSPYWTTGVTLSWDFGADGVASKTAMVKVFAISMVKVPTGAFLYNVSNLGGGATTGTTAYNNYSAGGTLSATITNAGLATGTGSNNLPYLAPVGWPNGYNSFYIGRYETTQGLWADFLNTIPSTLAATLHYGTVANGHNMTNSGTYPNKYAAVDPNASKVFMSLEDAWRYLSWAGLRPLTEMEFEKAGRDLSPDARVYPWGATPADGITYTPPNEGGFAIKKFANSYSLLTTKVLDVGRYMSGDAYRTVAETGASPWGIADLTGNAWEITISCKWGTAPLNGDGTPNLPASWPATGSDTVGFRGGCNGSQPFNTGRVSDRPYIGGMWDTLRNGSSNARGARNP